ncbi:MAG: sortase B protein-sorting domain-containing protein [Porcipelethomonas sp.]
MITNAEIFLLGVLIILITKLFLIKKKQRYLYGMASFVLSLRR